MNSFFCLSKTCKRFLSVIMTLLIFNIANAAIETVNTRQASPGLAHNSFLKLQDNKYDFMFANPTTWGNTFFNKKVTNRVVFSIDQRNKKYQPLHYSAVITFSVSSKAWNGSGFQLTTVSKTLQINYKNDGTPHTDRAVYEFTGASAMDIQVTNLVVTGASLSQCNLSLDAEIETERYYKFDPLFVPTNLSHRSTDLVTTGELEIYWGFIPGAEEYDLEWVYINNYNTGGEIAAADLKVDERSFQFNSTRISTSNTHYKIPDIYGKGYILYRLRARGKTSKDNYADYISGAWSTSGTSFNSVEEFAKKFKNTEAHNDKLNWQFSASYAEGGKSKAVVNYFDGSLRNRQSVTKSKTNEQIIVGESIYDYQGRPAVQVLPTPVNSPKIAFNPNFNQNAARQPYSKKDFDEDADNCIVHPVGMRADVTTSPNQGASNYYSSYNPDKTDQQAYIPDAQLYPFTQVEYTPDNTGRIRAQGGVGELFQVDGTHKTSYFYSAPEQEELDRLFGSEAGDAAHYKKNLVRDANGQLSISYLDPQGRVVATCLAGVPAAENLIPLTSARNENLRTDLLAKVKATDFSGSKNELDLNTRSLVVHKQLVPETDAKAYFSYEVRGQKYEDLCPLINTPVCYDCIFDLKIKLTDECGTHRLNGVGVANGVETDPKKISDTYPVPSVCSTAAPSFSQGVSGDTDTWETSANLDKNKTYTLSKTLTLNQEALDKYTTDYLKSNCVMTYQNFKDEEMLKMDFSGCNVTCQECADKLGLYKDYDIRQTPACNPCMTQEQWQKLYDQCFENCNQQSSACDAGLQSMLADVSLLGQYGQIMPGGSTVNGKFVDLDPSVLNPEAYPLSVFNEANQLPRKKSIQDAYFATGDLKNIGWAPTWRFPYNPKANAGKNFTYLYENGDIALIPVTKTSTGTFVPEITIAENQLDLLPDGRKAVRPQFLKNIADFVHAWDAAWSEALVNYHPEYEYYNFCVDISASHDFDEIWENNEHVANLPSGWKVTGVNGEPRMAYMNPAKTGIDPYFTSANPNYSEDEKNALIYAMDHYASGKSIWDVAYITVHCPNTGGTVMTCGTVCTYSNTNFNDEEWAVFSALYFGLKQKFQQQHATRYAIDKGAYNGCIGAENFDPFMNRFYQSIQTSSGAPWNAAPFNFGFFRSQFFNFEQPCNWSRYTLYKEKQIRFPGISNLLDINALNADMCYATNTAQADFEVVDCPAKTQAILDESKKLAELSMYQQCGQCPNAHHLEVFLNGLVTRPPQSKIVSSNTQLTCYPTVGNYPEFTNELASLFPGAVQFPGSLGNLRYTGVQSTNATTNRAQLQITFANEGPLCTMSMTFTNIPTLTTPVNDQTGPPEVSELYDFNDITGLCCLKGITNSTVYAYVANRNFQLTATVKVKPGDPLYDAESLTDPKRVKYREFIIEGVTSCFDVGGCTFDPICKTSKEAVQLQNLLNAMLYKAPASGGDPAIDPAFTNSTLTYLKDIPHVKAAYLAIAPTLNRAKDVIDVNGELNWYWELNSSTSNHIEIQIGIDPLITDHASCGIILDLPSGYSPSDLISFSGIKPSGNNFEMRALVKKTSQDPEYIIVTGSMPCLKFGDCTDQLPGGMITGNTKATSAGLGKISCLPSTAALAMQAELNSAYIVPGTKSRNFTCTGSGLTFTLDASGCGSTVTGTLHFPAGSEFGNCSPSPGYSNYQDIVAFSGISPDMDFVVAGLPNHNFIIYATMSNGVKVQLKGNIACIVVGDCYPDYGDCKWAENKVKNGDFEKGQSEFFSQYTYSSSLSGTDPYYITKDAATINSSWTGKDHTSGYGNFIIARSDLNGKYIWKQENIKVEKNTNYRFSAWIRTIPNGSSFGIEQINAFKVSFDGNETAAVESPGTPIPASTWQQVQFYWFSGDNTGVELKLLDYSNPDYYLLFALDDIAFQACQTSALCELQIPTPQLDVDPDPCHTQLEQIAISNATIKYQEYMAGIRKQFQENYMKKCLDVYEEFHMTTEDTQHHFTLYYYDQAGNLVRTIPPAGVELITNASELEKVRLDRFNRTHTVFTHHTMATTYKYNSLNQLVAQTSPDVDNLNIWKPQGTSGIPSNHTVSNTVFSDATHGTAFTKDDNGKGHLYTTADGKTWTELTNVGVMNLTDVQYVSSTLAYAVGGNGTVMETTDGGSHWSVLPAPSTTTLIACLFSSQGNGNVFDNSGAEWTTANGGVVWTEVNNGLAALLGNTQITDMRFSGSTAVAVTNAGTIFKLISGTWTGSSSIRGVDLNKVCEISGKYYAIGKDGRFLKSTDNGSTWQQGENALDKELKNMYFDYPYQGWAIDAAGTVMRTDAVQTWTPVSIPGTATPVFANIFFSGHEGYAVTSSGLYSIFNGTTWSALTSTTVGSNIASIYCIAPFATTNLGFMASTAGVIYKKSSTTSWNVLATLGTGVKEMHFAMLSGDLQGAVLGANGHMYSINTAGTSDLNLGHPYKSMSFTNDTDGYAIASDGYVATTTDGGETWTQATGGPSTGNLVSLFMTDNTNGIAVGTNGEIWKKESSGWSDISGRLQLPYLNGVTVLDANKAYLVGRDGTLIKTTNLSSGDNWQQQLTGTSKNILAVAASGEAGVAVGAGGYAAYTSDGGSSSWNTVATNTTADLNQVLLASGSAYAVGTNNAVIKSVNAGQAWSVVTYTDSNPQTLLAVAGNGGNVLAVGEKGKILKSNGTTWTPVSTFTPPVINDAQMLGSNGIAVGNNGSALTTSSKGAQWNLQSTGVVQQLNAVHMFPATQGKAIAVGNAGRVIQTTNGGLNWTASIKDAVNWNTVHFAGNVGIVAGDNGKAYLSTTGGASWSSGAIATGTTATLNAVYVVDPTLAYLVGNGSTILKVAINGSTTTCTALSAGVSADFTDVFFRDYETGYVIGKGGKLLKTINGGSAWVPENLGTGTTDHNDITVLDNNNLIISGGSGNVTHLTDLKDEFASLFWYDQLGRLVVSQNGKQYEKTNDHLTYSYTIYDELGRINEVGEIHAAAPDIMAGTGPIEDQYIAGELSQDRFNSWIDNGIRSEITRTSYDEATAPSISGFIQKNLQKRVSATYVDNNSNTGDGYEHATYYSYDIHGNVKSLLQDNPKVWTGNDNHRFKQIDYEYDLISGNVKQVSYQANQADAFYHKYLYDADNRITHVYTSKDKVIWDEDVKYFYYKHGPLARTELGNEKVQAIDYAYTLQGWIKGINSTNLTAGNDIGKDGEQTSSTNANKNIGRDVASYSLNYYLDTPSPDYTAIGSGAGNFMASAVSVAYSMATAKSLYNGNISSMATTILNGSDVASPQLTAYKYDQLNRIKELNAYRDKTTGNESLQNNSWSAATDDESYASSMIYDANGNITHMKANGNTGSINRDDLSYTYDNTTRKTNRLKSVSDAYTTSDLTDIETQPTNNYGYDAIGNLISDASENISSIEWTVYGKIKSIQATGTKANLEFGYDANGNRIIKKVIPKTGDATTTYYVRDASGNVMATYEKKSVSSVIDLYLQEQHVFGSSRVGVQTRDLNLTTPATATNPYDRILGQKEFELSNHLGNVLSTVNDARMAYSSGGSTTDYYKATVTSARDYYAFGAQMQGRGITGSSDYRYGFNGQEKDDEVSGGGNSLTAEFWQYDTRLGRRWNLDPIKKPWQSDYLCFSGNPILRFDEKGDDDIFDSKGKFLRSTPTGHNIKIETVNNGKVRQDFLSVVAFQMVKIKDEKGDIRVVGTDASNSIINNIAQHYYEGDATFKLNENPGNFAETFRGDNKNIHISVDKDGRTPVLLNDYNNLFSIILHEDKHRKGGENDQSEFEWSERGIEDHLNVYLEQFGDPSFKKTSATFKETEYKVYEGYLDRLNGLTSDDPKTDSDKTASYREKFETIKNENEDK